MIAVAPAPMMISDTAPGVYVFPPIVREQIGNVFSKICELLVLVNERPLPAQNTWALEVSKPLTTTPWHAVRTI